MTIATTKYVVKSMILQKGSGFMSEREKQIMKTFASIIPQLSESDKSYLLGLGEGIAFKVKSQEKKSDKKMVKE